MTVKSEAPNRILVVGCGGVGGLVAARLVRAGHDVSTVTHNLEIAEAVGESGIVASWDDTVWTARLPAYASFDEGLQIIPFDLCILAVPPDAATEALEHVLPHLASDAPIICLPNGLIERHLTRIVPADRLVGAIVEFGARAIAPGRVTQTAPGGFTIGQLRGVDAPEALARAAAALSDVGPVHPSENFEGARWSKLAINCAISALGTIGGDRLGVLMRHRFVRRLALEAMTEVVAVAQSEGVQVEKVSGTLDLEWLALSPEERLMSGSAGLLAKHGVLLAVGAKFRKMRSSMLSAIERGRKPSVDYLNGEIVSRGDEEILPVPVNQALLEYVHDVAEGRRESSIQTLRTLYRDTRPVMREMKLVG